MLTTFFVRVKVENVDGLNPVSEFFSDFILGPVCVALGVHLIEENGVGWDDRPGLQVLIPDVVDQDHIY